MKSWWFRMKPRSILRTIEWFPSFAKLEGRDWNETDDTRISASTGKSINTTRRDYIFDAHGESLEYSLYEFMSGRHDMVDVESAARNDKISFEFFGFGYVDYSNIIRVTEAGRLILDKKMSDEYLLKQLLKIQFPSPIIKNKHDEGYIFPMEILLNTFKEFDYITQLEMALLFGCMNITDLDITISAIKQFREEYESLGNKLIARDIINIYSDILKKTYPETENKPETYVDYADAFIRALVYTGLFLTRGRGIHTKLYIPDHSRVKINLLQEKHEFIYNNEQNLDLYMQYFGNPYNIILPWDNLEDRKILVIEKIRLYKSIINNAKQVYKDLNIKDIAEIEALINTENYNELVIADEKLSDSILSINEQIFINHTSKTSEVRSDIIEKFYDIETGTEDMAALWLEVNTWKAIVSFNGNHRVKRNFNIEEDLTPKSFAPGLGNTPDMEVYVNGIVLIPEVSLMSGVRQWEHEGSSVIDHVLKFIKKYENKEVYGIFISKTINVRTMWQFFVLNRESWVVRNVPVIPITIIQFIKIITIIYENELDIHDFLSLIIEISKNALTSENYMVWENNIKTIIDKWIATNHKLKS